MEKCTKNDENLKSNKYRQYLAAFIVNILSISNGLSAAWSSPVQKVLESSKESPLSDYGAVSKDLFSWITSVLYIGGLIGIFIWSKCADKFGRKINGYLICCTQIIGWIGIIFAITPTHLIISRFIIGLGGCGIISNSQLYISETTDNDIKGPLCALILVFTNVGIILVNVLGVSLSYNVLNICCLCFPVVFILLYFWLPETPFYFSMQNRPDEFKKSMNWFGLREESTSCQDNPVKISYRDLFFSNPLRRITVVAMGLLICQQFSGIGAILAYSENIFKSAGSPISGGVSSILVACFQLVISAISSVVIRSSRRKTLLLFAYISASFSFLLIYCNFHSNVIVDWYILKFVPIFGVLCFIIVYNIGIGPLPLVIIPEMFPPQALNRGTSLSLVVLVFGAFTVLKLCPIVQTMLGTGGLFLLLSCLNCSFAVFVWQFVWETKPVNDDKELKSSDDVAIN